MKYDPNKINERITDILAHAVQNQDPHGSHIHLTDFVLLHDNGGELIDQKSYIDNCYKNRLLFNGKIFKTLTTYKIRW